MRLYTYDEAGRLLGEYDNTATPRVRQETVYLGNIPVAVLTQTVSGSPAVFTTNVFYVYADHLDTPRVITQASDNRMCWRWDQADPFGIAQPNANPATIGAFAYGPRFPGQFFDPETTTHYNYFRTSDARIGRYIQSDPIGLAGGINTYAYVNAQPTSLVDPDGRIPGPVGPMISGGFNFGYQVFSNYSKNGGDLRSAFQCVAFKAVGTAALVGAFIPGVFTTTRSLGTEAFVSNLSKNLMIGVPIKFGLDQLLPDWRPFDPTKPGLTYDRSTATLPEIFRNLPF